VDELEPARGEFLLARIVGACGVRSCHSCPTRRLAGAVPSRGRPARGRDTGGS
jgi:hypothetical protein